jgi:hypothetical protein
MVGRRRVGFRSHPDKGSCGVCNTQLGEPIVQCAVCLTPHHLECFEYNGRCSIFGCGSTALLLSGAAQDPTWHPVPVRWLSGEAAAPAVAVLVASFLAMFWFVQPSDSALRDSPRRISPVPSRPELSPVSVPESGPKDSAAFSVRYTTGGPAPYRPTATPFVPPAGPPGYAFPSSFGESGISLSPRSTFPYGEVDRFGRLLPSDPRAPFGSRARADAIGQDGFWHPSTCPSPFKRNGLDQFPRSPRGYFDPINRSCDPLYPDGFRAAVDVIQPGGVRYPISGGPYWP